MEGGGASKGFTEIESVPGAGQQAHPVRPVSWVGGRGHQDPGPLRHAQGPPKLERPPPQYSSLRESGGWEAPSGPNPAAGAAGSSNSRTGAIYRQQPPASPRSPAPNSGPQGPAAPVISPVPAPGWARADPLSTPRSTHTLSRLWAWVRGDSSGSTRRSWGAASESIPASLGPCGPRWGPEGQARPPPGVFSPPGRTDAGTGARGRVVLT